MTVEISVSFLGPSSLALCTAAIAYLLGCINGSILISKCVFRDDIRVHGSGNAGLTNFYRTYGTKGVVGVLACDILKAVLAAAIGGVLFGSEINAFAVNLIFSVTQMQLVMFGKLWATIFVLLGHMYPVTFKFKGGKGVLSGVSALLLVDWRIALIALGVFLILVLLTRYVSLGSVGAALTFAIGLWCFYHNPILECLGAVSSGLVIYAHRANISRLIHGKENKFSLHRKEDGGK